ncbi:hypothetical protein GGI17_005574 [Coemansia sp. S146]|nr:hypothetical protein GGI17_005574 [Coemansia sp. S146]
MSTLSPLQTLPIHVAQMIADHVVGSNRLRLDKVTVGTEGYGMLLLPLLGVCHSLRAAAASLLCKMYDDLRQLQTNPDQTPLIADSYLGNFVGELFQLADDVSYNITGTTMSFEYQPIGIRHLVHMDAYRCDKSQLMMDLARRNATTMEFLTIGFWFLDDTSPLIQSADGSYVQYPCLYTLLLGSNLSMAVPLRPVYLEAVPLPVLWCLTMGSACFFGDDTPFRGTADTFELLDLHLSPEAFKVLKTHKIFTPVSYQQLRRVKLGQITRREQNSSALMPIYAVCDEHRA